MPYYCDFCGRKMTRKLVSHGHTFCSKHYNQFKKYGRVLDNNPRISMDRNKYHIAGVNTYIDLYDHDNNVIAQTVIDTEDLNKVQYTKWRLSGSGYAVNAPKFNGGNTYMSHVILGTNQFVDHINHNILDNRKENLRIVIKSQNQTNLHCKGVSGRKDGKYFAHIKVNQKMINLGVYVFEEEALFARWYAEKLLFGEYRYLKDKPVILPDREKAIMKYVEAKVQRL